MMHDVDGEGLHYWRPEFVPGTNFPLGGAQGKSMRNEHGGSEFDENCTMARNIRAISAVRAYARQPNFCR